MSEKSVGIVLLTEVPDMGMVAVLRERGFFNFEKMAFESWPGACQVTVHGKLTERDSGDFLVGLSREIYEELGGDFASEFWAEHSQKIVEIFKHTVAEGVQIKETRTFAAKVGISLLARIRLAPDSGCLRFVREEEVRQFFDVRIFARSVGVEGRYQVAMFPDEKEAVTAAFAKFS